MNQIGEKRRPEEENPTPTEERSGYGRQQNSSFAYEAFQPHIHGWMANSFLKFFPVLFYSDCCMSVISQ